MSNLGVAVLLSGHGSNLQALLDAQVPVRLAITDCHGSGGIALARACQVTTAVLEPAAFATSADHDRAIANTLEAYGVSLVALAGYMRVLGAEFCARFAGRAINLHPSLLPLLPGRDTHQRALAAGHTEHGCTVHWLTKEVDSGPVIRQARVPVLPGDDAQSLAARVCEREHELLPAVVRDILAGEVVAPC